MTRCARLSALDQGSGRHARERRFQLGLERRSL